MYSRCEGFSLKFPRDCGKHEYNRLNRRRFSGSNTLGGKGGVMYGGVSGSGPSGVHIGTYRTSSGYVIGLMKTTANIMIYIRAQA